ncbi:MAG: UMP kinase, partial [Candidatus Aenigmarchaeota archaeon]|nr:UMP kinase [Candidatus Aenigmarchaeota archaeon]
MSDTFVISLGGSVIVPSTIDIAFLKKFKTLILRQVKKGKKFVIVCGGGRISRTYQQAARDLSKINAEDLDWLGIHTTRLNASLLRTIFRKHAHRKIIKNPTKKFSFKEKILVASGWQPGCSTDYDAVLLAKQLKIKKLINLSDINYVYDRDPKTHTDAKKLDTVSWAAFRKMLPR